jgi:hypothetical protein
VIFFGGGGAGGLGGEVWLARFGVGAAGAGLLAAPLASARQSPRGRARARLRSARAPAAVVIEVDQRHLPQDLRLIQFWGVCLLVWGTGSQVKGGTARGRRAALRRRPPGRGRPNRRPSPHALPLDTGPPRPTGPRLQAVLRRRRLCRCERAHRHGVAVAALVDPKHLAVADDLARRV